MQSGERFDRFTEQAKQVLSFAQEEAQRYQHHLIGTEHLLLGLLRDEEGLPAKGLYNLGVDLNRVRQAVEFIIGRGNRVSQGEVELTPRIKKVLALSVDEARRLNHPYVGTEHLLLGLVREGDGIAAGVLSSMGVDLQRVRAEILRLLSPPEESFPYTGLPTLINLSRLQGLLSIDYPLSQDCISILNFANSEAQRLRHKQIGPEHLLLGILHDKHSMAAHVLLEAGATPAEIYRQLAALIPQEEAQLDTIRDLAPLTKAQIYLAAAETHRLGAQKISPEHLLLGMFTPQENPTTSLLTILGIDWRMLRNNLAQMLANPKSE